MSRTITRVAVIGAGTMGGGIAAHFANAGFQVDLLDVPPPSLTPDEEKRGLTLDSPAVRNRFVNGGWDRVKKSRPAALFTADTADRVRLGNTADHFGRLADADWIIEAIIEQLEPKRDLMARIDAVRKPGSVVSTNTSGIPVSTIAEGRSQSFRAHFLGTHFFNPPRYLKLLEVIPTADTDPDVVEFVTDFATRHLGKGVVIAKDTPNFIANRLGSFDGMYSMKYALDHGLTVEEVDFLAGPMIGNPKTALFRLQDLVGLDIATHVARNLYDAAPTDESRDIYQVPATIGTMLERKMLGNKTGQGFYKEVRENGKREYWTLDLKSLEYRPPARASFPEIDRVRKLEPMSARLQALMAVPDSRASGFLWSTTANSLAYASRRMPEIADDLASVDRAMKWGFSRQFGPFETWDMLGVPETVARMDKEGIQVAPWVHTMLRQGHTSFYKTADGLPMVYDIETGTYQPVPVDPKVIDLDALRAQGKELKRNDSASLLDLGDGVLCLEVHTKANILDEMVFQMGEAGLARLDQPQWVGLVIGNQGDYFGAGANVALMAMNVMAGQWDVVNDLVAKGQQFMQQVRFSPKPIVAAPFGMTLGGCGEISMAASRRVASAETYMGLVEVGLGIIPGWGGCKEIVRRVVSPPMKTPGVDPLPFLERAFTQIGTARVSASAEEARQMGMLDGGDLVVMHPDHVLGEAKQAVLDMAATYQPPAREKTCYAAGKLPLAALKMGVWTFQQAGQISAHDATVGRKLAWILAGGDLAVGQWTDEQYFLDLERTAFIELLKEPKTIERIMHFVQTGKPLRN